SVRPTAAPHHFPTRRSSDLTDIEDYQAQVQTADIGVNRGYLANAEEVQVRGFEIDGRIVLGSISLQGAYAWTDGEYVSFTNAHRSEEHTSELQSRENLVCGL